MFVVHRLDPPIDISSIRHGMASDPKIQGSVRDLERNKSYQPVNSSLND